MAVVYFFEDANTLKMCKQYFFDFFSMFIRVKVIITKNWLK